MHLYRTAWLVVLLPLLLVAFTITRPAPLPRSTTALAPTFDARQAARRARELAALYPERAPGTPASGDAAAWVRKQLTSLGLRTKVDVSADTIPGRGRALLRNVVAVVPGHSLDPLVVIAHRDSTPGQPGQDDNASGTGALIELARAYTATRSGTAGGVSPNHTLLFVSTDAGAFGLLGARALARSGRLDRAVAVVALDAIASGGRPYVAVAGRGPRSPDPRLVATVSARLGEEGPHARLSSPLAQLIDLAFPFGLTEQLELVSRGVPAVAVSGGGARPQRRLDLAAMERIGTATESALASLDASLEPAVPSRVHIYSRGRVFQGWAIILVYVAVLVPFAVALTDLMARLRRWRVPLGPAARSFGRRLAFWLWAGVVFLLFGLAGAWPDGDPAPINPDSQAAGHWPRLALALYALAVVGSWLVARTRLVRRGPVAPEDEVAGMGVAIAALAGIALVLIVTNAYALLFVLPSAHAWLLLVQHRDRRAWARAALYLLGLTGPLLLLGSVAFRFGLGLDAPWYLAELAAVGYVPKVGLVLSLAWAAVAAQVYAVAAERYAPYPPRAERPTRGPIGSGIAFFRTPHKRRALTHTRAGEGDASE